MNGKILKKDNQAKYEKMQKNNTELNNREYEQRKIRLDSYPQAIFIQMDAPCTQDCIFCSRPKVYKHFDLESYKKKFEEKLNPVIQRAKRLNLTGSGELLILAEAKKVLAYFNQFKHTEKMFATNGSTLTPKMIDFIAESYNRYVIHISIHACDPCIHRVMTQSEKNYDVVCYNLQYLKKVKEQVDNIAINFIFLATTKNIENLFDFIKFGQEHNADGIIVYYNYIYRLEQKELSCFFMQDKTNIIFDSVKKEAEEKGITLILPPKFKQNSYPQIHLCREAWSQIMLNYEGAIISCDVSGDSNENINGKDFIDVWNGSYYTNLRQNLINGENACSKYCIRANPSAVNNFRSHIITRGKRKEEIEELLKGT